MDTQINIIKKSELGWKYTFVDARGSKQLKLFLNPGLVKAGFKSLHSEKGINIGK